MKYFSHIYIALILFIFCFLSLITLGSWQISRHYEKTALIQAIEHNLTSQPISLSDNNSVFSKVVLKGHFLPNQYVFLYGRRSAETEKDGYYLLSVFQSDDNKKYLVSRGWLPISTKHQIENFTELELETIHAIIMNGEKKGFMIPQNDSKNNIWFTIDLNAAKEHFGTDDHFYLMQINSANLPLGAKLLTGNSLSKLRNDHLEYAITWYCLALSLLVVFLIKIKKPT
jgi:surfeit locus 1 family protein